MLKQLTYYTCINIKTLRTHIFFVGVCELQDNWVPSKGLLRNVVCTGTCSPYNLHLNTQIDICIHKYPYCLWK